jgi:DNA polymerase-1
MTEPLYLIDGYGLIYRSYYAFIRAPLTNPRGQNSSAVFGFFRSLFQLLKDKNPRYLAVVMDSRRPTFRHELFPAYKANREKAPEDLHAQVDVIEEILAALGVPSVRRDGFEADDLMATLAETCRRQGRDCYILSADKDLLQLVGGGVYVLHPGRGGAGTEVWGPEKVREVRQIAPQQMVDYLALCGDASDNIPGVPGVGDKTAVKLLTRYQSLDEIYAQLDSVTPEGVKKKLAAGRENALLSRELARLRNDVALSADLEPFRLRALDTAPAVPLFLAQGMRSLAAELGGEVEAEPDLGQLVPGSYEAVLDEASLTRWIEAAARAGVFAFDTETDGLDALVARPLGFSLALAAGKACYIPIVAPDADCLPERLVRAKLKPLLEEPGHVLVGQNIKYDYKIMRRWGVDMACRFFDTMVAAWILDSSLGGYGMDSLAERYLRYRTLHYRDLVGKNQTLADIGLAEVCDYSGEDADITYRLYELFSRRLDEEKLYDLFSSLEMPLIEILGEMELAGIRLSPEALQHYQGELETALSDLEAEAYRISGHPFNIRSTKELQRLLFEERKLKPIKKTKTGFSTDNQVLEALAAEDPLPELVLKHRLLAKLKSTYVDSLPQQVNTATGRLHTHFLQTGAATGRLASRDPNLQNIPVREEGGRRIRAAFVPAEGFVFLSADYSQIELVVLAHLSGDPLLSEAFRAGEDVHRMTAAVIFGIDSGEVTFSQRRIGKTINFGVIYGMSAFRLARDLKIPRREADDFIARYFERYAGIQRFIDDTIAVARSQGYVETIAGRRRRVPHINSRNHTEKMAAQRIAVNSRIQGSAADIVKRAMIAVCEDLRREKTAARLLLQVHDELIFEVRRDDLAEAEAVIRGAMERVSSLSVPLRVSCESGGSWGEIH